MTSSGGLLRRSSTLSFVSNTNSNRQKAGKTSTPRSMTVHSKQAKNEKPSVTHVDTTDYFSFKKDSARTKDSILYSPADCYEPLKNKSSRTLRKSASTPILQLSKLSKKVEPLLGSIKEKPRQKAATSPLPGNSKIPVPTSTEKKSVSTPKKENTTTRASHRNCSSCSRKHHNNTHHNMDNKVNTVVKRKNSRLLRFNKKDNQDNQVHAIKNDDASPTTSKKSLIPKLSQKFKKRVSPFRSSTPTLSKIDELPSVSVCESTSLSETDSSSLQQPIDTIDRNLSFSPIPIYDDISSSQKSKPEASSISITNNVLVSTTTYIIKPEISLFYNAEKNSSDIKHQNTKHQVEEIEDDENEDVPPTVVNNVCKNIMRFSKFILKIKSIA